MAQSDGSSEASPQPSAGSGRTLGLWIGGAAFLALLAFPVSPENLPASRLAAVAALMAVWWVSDAIPLFATALLPLVLYPLLGIMGGGELAPRYFNSTIVLFLGGFLIALTMERWNLHRRIALNIIHWVGGGPERIVLGFMLASAFLSMWISNTATAVMMVPIGLAIVLQIEDEFDADTAHEFTVGLMLGIAYACSVGGLTTLVGTPPNLALIQIFEILFPDAPRIGFGQWMMTALPIGLVMLTVSWFLITRVFYRPDPSLKVEDEVILEERAALGAVRFEERVTLGIFAATALLWVFRSNLNLGFVVIPGWSNLLPYPELVDDGTVAIAMASLMFFIPTRTPGAKADRVLGVDVIPRLPWDIVLLFGGGFALAAGFQETGLAQLIGEQFQALGTLPAVVSILLVCIMLTFLTELTSNLATAQTLLPILASIAVATDTNPLLLLIPATLSASCAFMMPVATPPNAIVFGSGRISVSEMARIGIVLNLIGAVVVTASVFTVGRIVFDIDPSVFPAWAETMAPPGSP